MKKLVLLTVLLLAAGGLLTANTSNAPELFTQDARVMGMGGAFTAVADDVYALFYNPAGLAYLDKGDLMLGFTVYTRLDPANYDKLIAGEEVDFFDLADTLVIAPRAGFASRGWGIAAISNITVKEFSSDVDDPNEKWKVEFVNNLGLMGGLSANFGPLALGANLRLYKSFEFYKDDIEEMPEFSDLAGWAFDFEKIADAEDNFKVGVGAMFTLGTLTAGAYVDDFMTLMGEENEGFGDIFDKALDTAKVGVAFTPFKNRLNPQQFSPLNLIIAADINNIGDDNRRSVNFGTELGIHLGKAVTVDLRGGYKQFVGDDFSFKPEDGEVFFGFGSKFLALDLNLGFSYPALFIQDAFDGEEDQKFADYDGKPRFVVSGGLRL